MCVHMSRGLWGDILNFFVQDVLHTAFRYFTSKRITILALIFVLVAILVSFLVLWLFFVLMLVFALVSFLVLMMLLSSSGR